MLKYFGLRAASVIAVAACASLVAASSSASAAPDAPNTQAATTSTTYTVSSGSVKPYAYPTDTPAYPYIDKDGTFYFQQSAALYGKTDPRYWAFYTGTNFDNAKRSPISDAVNPADPTDKNNNTTARCNNSPTGRTASYAPNNPGYSQRNYCDLSSVWVDPDTGDWYGLVHNEFTPAPFEKDGNHFDAIDYAVSKDQGKTWSIKDKVITSPYSTTRGDTTQFPNETYYYGDGDQRLLVDTASGYFYVYYGSRVLDKNGGGWGGFSQHVARAPISQKMAPGSWQKYFEGKWQTAGLGGKESNIVSVSNTYPDGYVPTSQDYNPQNKGTWQQQVANGTLLKRSDLFIMNVSYNAYLGKYIGTPENDGSAPLRFYATDDLATQKWTDIGSTPNYSNASWYRWMVDSATATTGSILGKTFRSYCSIECSVDTKGNKSSGEYVDVTIDSNKPAAPLLDPSKSYLIKSGSGEALSQSGTGTAVTKNSSGAAQEQWKFSSNNDGSYTITNNSSGLALGVPATVAGRAWGSKPTLTALAGSGSTVNQQWFIQRDSSNQNGSYRLINRFSSLVISLSSGNANPAQTTPYRNWDNSTGNPVGANSTTQSQSISLEVSSSTSSTGPLIGVASQRCLDVPDNSKTNGALVSIWDCNGGSNQQWNINSAGEIRVYNGSKCLDLLDSKSAPGSAVGIWDCTGGANQKWAFNAAGGIRSGSSGLCLNVLDGKTTNGAPVKTWNCNNGTNQQWKRV